jgi:hypothetical protein
MTGELTAVEIHTLIEVLQSRLEGIRGDILDSEDYAEKVDLKKSEDVLRRVLSKLEHRTPVSIEGFLREQLVIKS